MQFDFDSINTELQKRLSLLSSWSKVLFFGVYARLTEAVSYIIEKLAFLAETYYREANWETATKLKSIGHQAKFLSYYPHRKIGASGEINVVAGNTLMDTDIPYMVTYSGSPIMFPKWTQACDTDKTVFVYLTEAKIIENGYSGTLALPVKEGVVKTYTYEAQGVNNETIYLVSDSVDNDMVQVDIVDANGAVLHQVEICNQFNLTDTTLLNPEKLYFVQDTVNYYCEVRSSASFEQVEIQFGDNIYGKKLSAGEYVKITYGETEGATGNITQIGKISEWVDTIYTADGDVYIPLVANFAEISNGNDIESIEDIRNYGNRLFVSGYRCGGYDDWKTILEDTAIIYKANVANADELLLSGSTYTNKVFVTAVSADGSTLTTDQKATVVTDLKTYNKKGVTEIVSWYDPIIVYLMFKINAHIGNQPFSVIRETIKTALTAQYGILNVDFQQNIYESNFITYIDNISYIDYHETELFQMEKNVLPEIYGYELALSYPSTKTSALEDQIFLEPNTLEIWISRKKSGLWDSIPYLIAEDQSGIIVGLGGDLLSGGLYTVTNSAINYTTNIIDYKIDTIINDPLTYGVRDPGSGSTGYILSLAYKTQDGNGEQLTHVRLPESRFITDIDNYYTQITLAYTS